jgi:opacity protein-like surface antigen
MAAMPPAARAEGFAIALDGGYYDMTNASQSAKAVFDGSSGGFTFGAFLRMALGLDQSWFVGAGGRTFSKEGERVFVADPDSPPFPLGHPLKVRVTPLYALVGYRLSPDSAFRPYLGVGPGLTLYKEESSVAGESFDQSASKVSFHGVLGAEYGRGKIRFGIEGMYTTAPNTLGEEGVSQVYDETDAGGFSAVGRIIIAF